jgi:hypothetical protein
MVLLLWQSSLHLQRKPVCLLACTRFHPRRCAWLCLMNVVAVSGPWLSLSPAQLPLRAPILAPVAVRTYAFAERALFTSFLECCFHVIAAFIVTFLNYQPGELPLTATASSGSSVVSIVSNDNGDYRFVAHLHF